MGLPLIEERSVGGDCGVEWAIRRDRQAAEHESQPPASKAMRSPGAKRGGANLVVRMKKRQI
ncbi:MAG: hypothetical protein CL933_04525 [Deltaproteobacteria bacterium]|nr:hypothetical protein [Deltaproteobacteria bacterium]